MRPTDLLWKELYDELERLGRRAPALLLVDGGDHSYYHDRHDFAWGTHTLRAIEATRRDLHASSKTAIGGFSMGGFGAFDLARSEAFAPSEATHRPSSEAARRHPPARSTTQRTSPPTTCSVSRARARDSMGRDCGSTSAGTIRSERRRSSLQS
jgi:hypothetical protein